MKEIFKLLIFIFIYTKLNFPLTIDTKTTNFVKNIDIYIVQKDDNLWKIAEKYDPNNKEEFIFTIKELNNLKNSNLYINQKLLVP